MKLIIEIPDKYVEALQVFKELGVNLGVEARAILNGTPATSEDRYAIIHYYDVDGGFGDAIGTQVTLGYVEGEEKAKEYIAKYNKPKTYAIPYSRLECHALGYKKVSTKMLDINVDPFKDDYFSMEIADGIVTLTNIVWDKEDKNYEDDFPTEIDVVSYHDVREWFCDLADDYCHAISFKKDGVLYTNPSAVD